MTLNLNRREFLLGATAVAATRGLQGPACTLEPAAAGQVLKTPDGRVALEYLTSKPAGSGLTSESACCFHPLNTPAGERITALAPSDHTTHRGVFLAWHAMEVRQPEPVRADFWGWGRHAPTDGRVITNRGVRLAAATARAASLEIDNDWTIEGRRVIAERTAAAWHAEPGANVLDLTCALTPDADLVIDQQAFGGFCVRARNDGESWYSNREGRVTLPNSSAGNPDLNWPAADWYAYSIALAGGATIGCAVLDHPSNPPSTWHTPRPVHFLQPCIVAQAPKPLAQGQTLTLRYRVVVFDGEVPVPLVDRLSREWRG